MNDIDNFKNRLKQLRKEQSITQQELADKIGIVRTAITNYETGRTIPDSETLSLIAKIFNTTTDYLLGNSNIKNPYKEKENTKEDNDISANLDKMKKQLATSDSLMFDGQPATEEQVQAILNAIEMGEAFAKQRAKEKFTPKKYRK